MSANQRAHVVAALRQRLQLPIHLRMGQCLPNRPVRGGAVDPALLRRGLHEMIGETPADFAAAMALALAAAGQCEHAEGAVLFGTLAGESQERGLLYGAGLDVFGLDAGRMVLIEAPSEKSLLWAAEEAAGCSGLASAVIVLGTREKLYGFLASRRLKLRLEKSGVPLFVVRAKGGEPTAATARWRVSFAPSDGLKVPGSPVPLLGLPHFRLRLERYAGLPPQCWEIECDQTHRLRVAATVPDRPAGTHWDDRRLTA
jgi:protein ImuA